MASNNNSSSPYGPLPPSNPVLTAYETFVKDTPLVTRYILTTLSLSYFLSWFVDPQFALANTPFHSLMRLELYRIVLSPLVCTDLLSLIFAFLGFSASGKKLEFAMGSSAFLAMLLAIGGMVNLTFLCLCILLYFMTNNYILLLSPSAGIWTLLLGIIAMECAKAPTGTNRRLFFLTVPTIYYPLALLALFSLFSKGFNFVYGISVAVGYAYGFDKLTFLQPSSIRCSAWEDGCLNNFTRRPGWVVGNAASGASAWEILPNHHSQQNAQSQQSGWSPASFFQGTHTDTGQSQQSATLIPPIQSFPSGAGRAVGESSSSGPSLRRCIAPANAREAMLAAAERRAKEQNEEKSNP